MLTLATACAVEGRVFDPELDKPVAHLAVVIQKFMSFEGVRTFIPAGRTMTDDDGKYRYASLSPGRYRLIVGPSQQPRMRPPDAGAEPLMIYPATYFPDSTSESGAMMIDLLPGAQQAGLDFRLKRSKAGRVRVKTARHQREASLWSACSGCPRA